MKKDKNLLTVTFYNTTIVNTIDMEKRVIYGSSGRPIKKLSRSFKNIILENDFDRSAYGLFLHFGVEGAIQFLSLLDKISAVGLKVESHYIEDLKNMEHELKLTKDLVQYCKQQHSTLKPRIIKEFEILKKRPQEVEVLLEHVPLHHLAEYVEEYKVSIDFVIDLNYKVFIRENLIALIRRSELFNLIGKYLRYTKDLEKSEVVPKNFIKESVSLAVEYNSMKNEIERKKFQYAYSKNYETQIGDYIVVQPKTPSDIILEGKNQNNCVGNYVDDIIKGNCVILFLRHKNEPKKSYITIEIRNKTVYQAKRQFNNTPSDDDKKILQMYENFLQKMSN